MSTVLVIEDDPKFSDAVAEMLVRAGYDVLRAADGNEAVEVLEKNYQKIDLAIVDLSLPGINGFELIGAISRRPNPIKIIATTSIYKDAHLSMAGTVGAHAAIRKPANGKPLPERDWLNTVRRLIGGSPRGRHANAVGAQGGRNDPETPNGTKNY